MQQPIKTVLTAPEPRKGMPDPRLDKAEFKSRFLAQYIDPAFERLTAELDQIADAAWDGYDNSRKSPRTVKAGLGYADPDYDLAGDWVEVKAVDRARSDYESGDRPQRADRCRLRHRLMKLTMPCSEFLRAASQCNLPPVRRRTCSTTGRHDHDFDRISCVS